MESDYSAINGFRPPICLAVHDICTYAKSSLTVVIPVMEALGVEVAPLPTAVLSSQIDGFSDYYHRDLAFSAEKIAACLDREGVKFDCLYSGFLSVPKMAGFVRSLGSLMKEDGLRAVDPVLGDHGKLYSSFKPAMVEAVRGLLGDADVIKPNWTEGCLLTGAEFVEEPSLAEAERLMERLRKLSPKADIAITDVKLKGMDRDMCHIACLEKSGAFWINSHVRESSSLPGSGDFFCSVMVSCLLKGQGFGEAVRIAGEETRQCIRMTLESGFEHRHGICTALWTNSGLG